MGWGDSSSPVLWQSNFLWCPESLWKQRKSSFSCCVARAAQLLEQSASPQQPPCPGEHCAPGWAQQPTVTSSSGSVAYEAAISSQLAKLCLMCGICLQHHCILWFVPCILHVFACAVSQCHGYGGGTGEPQSCFIPDLLKNIWAGSLLWTQCLEWLGSNLSLKKRPCLVLFVQSFLWSYFKCKRVKSAHKIQRLWPWWDIYIFLRSEVWFCFY